MATNFPTSLDNFTNPTSTDTMDSVTVPHATQHSNINDAVEALEAKVGINSSAVVTSIDYKLNNSVVLKSFVDAKGDLITASANDTPAILARGTDTYVLQANNSAANGLGLEWVIGGLRLISQTTYTSSTTFTMPTGAKLCYVFLYHAGGGGGGGARNTTTSVASGGGGGGGGPISKFVQPCTGSFAAGQTITVTIGAGGSGGAGATATGSGVDGFAGGVSRFVNNADATDQWGSLIFPGGRAGSGGTTGGSGTGAPGYIALNSWGLATAATTNGAGGSATSTVGGAGYKTMAGGTGGGAGGRATTVGYVGGAGGGGYYAIPLDPVLGSATAWTLNTGGGASGGLTNGGAGAAGTTVGSYFYGGGGGGANTAGVGGAGGVGAIGGGGGGGGGGNNSNNGGAGGDGGRAEMTVWIYG